MSPIRLAAMPARAIARWCWNKAGRNPGAKWFVISWVAMRSFRRSANGSTKNLTQNFSLRVDRPRAVESWIHGLAYNVGAPPDQTHQFAHLIELRGTLSNECNRLSPPSP